VSLKSIHEFKVISTGEWGATGIVGDLAKEILQ